ncbi:hypothetical protein ACGFZU_06365 [Streptomyces tendae]|uniref:hypothetical protein n=1 Tax=Streptomyces tendae TaxID=1932 RepID=UPI0037170A83
MTEPHGAAYEDLLAAVTPGRSANEARKLIADFAHELAELIRDHDYDPGEVGPIHLAYQQAADLIDPEGP